MREQHLPGLVQAGEVLLGRVQQTQHASGRLADRDQPIDRSELVCPCPIEPRDHALKLGQGALPLLGRQHRRDHGKPMVPRTGMRSPATYGSTCRDRLPERTRRAERVPGDVCLDVP